MSPPRDGTEIEALLTDQYLEALLAAADRGADDTPADADLDVEIRRAVAALRGSLVRVHPSFRFEERLAGQLVDLATSLRGPDRARPRIRPTVVPLADPFGPDPELDPFDRARPYLIGGAMASAALSIAGAAIVVWRRSRAAAPVPIAEVIPLGWPAAGGSVRSLGTLLRGRPSEVRRRVSAGVETGAGGLA